MSADAERGVTMPAESLDHDDAENHNRSICGTERRGKPPCRLPAGWGTDHVGVGACKLHLGTTDRHRKHAAKVIAEAKAAELTNRLVARLGADQRLRIGPAEATAHALDIGDQLLRWLYEDVLPDAGAIGTDGQPSAWLAELLRRVSQQVLEGTRAQQAGVAERLVAVEERTLDAFNEALGAALATHGIDPAPVRATFAANLRALGALEAASTALPPKPPEAVVTD